MRHATALPPRRVPPSHRNPTALRTRNSLPPRAALCSTPLALHAQQAGRHHGAPLTSGVRPRARGVCGASECAAEAVDHGGEVGARRRGQVGERASERHVVRQQGGHTAGGRGGTLGLTLGAAGGGADRAGGVRAGGAAKGGGTADEVVKSLEGLGCGGGGGDGIVAGRRRARVSTAARWAPSAPLWRERRAVSRLGACQSGERRWRGGGCGCHGGGRWRGIGRAGRTLWCGTQRE
mmetsp:Transcript_22855/g.61306  ORF Transcript_22855/g.61306 Transcript_22855/m.61306 type:complete len:236 (-) Transcript_22855:200-907(-)